MNIKQDKQGHDLAPGEIIAVDQPLYIANKASNKWIRCGICLMENNMNLLPCDGCTNIMFCRKCYETAMPEHKLICAVYEFIQNIDPIVFAMKSIAQIVSAFDWNDELKKFKHKF